MNLEDKILQKIRVENLQPKSVWYFLIKDYSLWGAVFVSVILAALAIAPIIFIFSNLEIGYIKHISSNPYTFILNFLPYLWIILCILTTYFASYAWSKTKNGYKFNGQYVIAISILCSLILGIILNQYQFGKNIDDQIHQYSFGQYKNQEQRMEENWFNPSQGRLIGIIKTISTSTFTIINEKNNFREEVNFDLSVPGEEFVENENKVRVIGFQDSNKTFFACAIFPDNMRPPRARPIGSTSSYNSNSHILREQIKTRFETNPECKQVFVDGRANFQSNFETK